MASHRISRPRRRTVLVVVLAGLALGAAGCSVTNPITTQNNYAASDGVRVELGDLGVINLLVLAAAEGEPGTTIGAVTNHGSDDVEVTIGLAEDGSGESFDLRAGATVVLGPEDEQIDFDAVPAAPGAMVQVSVASDRDGTTTVAVPVLDDTLPEFEGLIP